MTHFLVTAWEWLIDIIVPAMASFVLSFVVILFVAGTFGHDDAPAPVEHVTTVVVPAPTEDSVTLDYRHGGWYADGVRLPLSCPQEDTCAVDYAHGAWTLTEGR